MVQFGEVLKTNFWTSRNGHFAAWGATYEITGGNDDQIFFFFPFSKFPMKSVLKSVNILVALLRSTKDSQGTIGIYNK